MAFDLSSFLGNNAGALIGGVLGAVGSSKGGETVQTATRDPWAVAQPYMLQNLKDQSSLNDYYKKNPFNAQQQAGFNNTFADADHFRDKVAPGLLGFANNAMGGSYERQRGGAPGSGAGYGGLLQPGGRSGGGSGPFRSAPYMRAGQAEARSMGPGPDGSNMPRVQPSGGRFGQVDFAATNPYTNGAIPAPVAPAAAQTYGGLLSGGAGPSIGSGSNGRGGGETDSSTWQGGIGVGDYSDSIQQRALDMAKQFGIAGPVVGVLAGLINYGLDESQALEMVNTYGDNVGALMALQGHVNDPDEIAKMYGATPYSGSSSNNGSGSSFAGYSPSGNEGMSMASQYAAYGGGGDGT